MREAVSHDDEMRIETIASNVPALVFQLQRRTDGSLRCLFSSKAVRAVCGEQENIDNEGWIPCVSNLHPDDRNSFFAAMDLSARQLTHWNWEGRIIVPPRDEKWINLRAVPSTMPDGSTVWDGIILNITISKQREDENLHARFTLEKFSDHIQRAREEERGKIAREIHDELGGILSTLKLDLGWLDKRMSDPVLLERTQAMAQLLKAALQTARRISADLRPGALDNLGLLTAMEEHAASLLVRQGIAYSFSLPEREVELDDLHATAIFRIFQESLTNIVRHARAKSVTILFTFARDRLAISIHDDGCGMIPEPAQRPHSYGILGMQERARQLGGELTVNGMPGHGTTVNLSLPLVSAEHTQ